MKIVVVESPAKAKTLHKYLGPGYEVLASFGHVRDLPAKDGSVDPEHNFKMIWEVDTKSQKRLNDIARALKGANKLILATDPDREGEAISWHVLEALKEKHALKTHAVERVVFNAITKQAVLDAMKHPRKIDGALVDAYLARRAPDYPVAAAGSKPQARLCARAHHARCAAALRRRRGRRRDHRPHYLYAHRRRRRRGRGACRRPPPDRRRLRQELRAAVGAPVPDQDKERARGARGDPADRCRAPPAR